MEKTLAETLSDFHKELLKPEFDALNGKSAGHDDRLTEICGQLEELSGLLGRLEQALSASVLAGNAESAPPDPELKAVIEGNP